MAQQNQSREAPPRPQPNISYTSTPTPPRRSNRLVIGIIGGVVLILFALILIQKFVQVVDKNSYDAPVPVHIENQFIDIDRDGDQDYIQQADILFNCGGHYCIPQAPQATPAQPAVPATPASQAGGLPTPQVYFPPSALEPASPN